MRESICPKVMEDHSKLLGKARVEVDARGAFANSDAVLRSAIPAVLDNRRTFGLKGLVKGLQAVIINTEEANFVPAVKEIIDHTGFSGHSSSENKAYRECVLKAEGSADILVRHRKGGSSPFLEYNIAPKTRHLPNTRLETFVFETPDIERYVAVQRERGVRFLTPDILHRDNYDFIQTIPSSFTGNSIGFIQWKGRRGEYMDGGDSELVLDITKRDRPYLKNIKHLDHAATRLESKNRDSAIIEFMELTNYDFDFAIYVSSMNSITNVSRLSGANYAQVFTAGITPFSSIAASGPTEKYVHNYGPRVHHLAFITERIEETYEGLVQDGMGFLLELVGSPEEGLKQTFTKGSRNTFLVNEYIYRYGDFDGFFTRSNVTDLTRATGAQ